MKGLCSSCLPSARLSDASQRSSESHRVSSVETAPEIIVIGAGAAGIACATKLIQDGMRNVRVLEASNRIGGRIWTIPYADGIVDMGAQWCHGEKDNVVYDLVKDMNVLETTGEVYVSFECIRSNGEVVAQEVVQKLKELLTDLFVNQRDEMAEYEGSFGEFLRTRFFEGLSQGTKYQNIDIEIAREFFENFKKMESSESSLELDQVSARGFLEYWDCEGDYMLNWKDKGYQQLLKVLTRAKSKEGSPLGILQDKVIFNAKVVNIQWDREDGLIHVICENIDEPFVADNVVVTVSLGVLKKCASTMFLPELPETKMIAIRDIGYGDVFKVFMEFPHRFWPATWTGFTTLWREEDLRELQNRRNAWTQEVYGFYLVYYQPRVLEAWAVGPLVPEMEKLNTSELQVHMMTLLRRFLPHWKIPDPVSLQQTSWTSNENFYGAYSFRTLQTERSGTGANALAQPLSTLLSVPSMEVRDGNESSSIQDTQPTRLTMKPTVLFAGEATSIHHFSTVHGAVESGWREAKRLAGYYEGEME